MPKSSDSNTQASIYEQGKYTVCFRRYASLFFLVGFDGEENKLEILEWIHCFVETLDSIFSNVCELDILFNHDTVSLLIEDMIYNGQIVENNKEKSLERVLLTHRFQQATAS